MVAHLHVLGCANFHKLGRSQHSIRATNMLTFFFIVFSLSVVASIYKQSIEPMIIIGTINVLAYWSLTAFLQNNPEAVVHSEAVVQETPPTIAQLDIRSKVQGSEPELTQQGSRLETLPPIAEPPQPNPAKSENVIVRPAKPTPSRGTSDYF